MQRINFENSLLRFVRMKDTCNFFSDSISYIVGKVFAARNVEKLGIKKYIVLETQFDDSSSSQQLSFVGDKCLVHYVVSHI